VLIERDDPATGLRSLRCLVPLHRFGGPTKSAGGIGITMLTGFHQCRQYGWQSTYSDLGGRSCITHSCSFQKRSQTNFISSHVGQRSSAETDTCSQPVLLCGLAGPLETAASNAPPGASNLKAPAR